MARVLLDVEDLANQLTLKLMLQADGHLLVEDAPEVVLIDAGRAAAQSRQDSPVLVLAAASDIPAAVAALRNGAQGIVHLPLQPGEAGVLVRRAVHAVVEHEGVLMPPGLPLKEVEARYVAETLRRCKGNQAETARVLGIGRNTLWRWLGKEKGQT